MNSMKNNNNAIENLKGIEIKKSVSENVKTQATTEAAGTAPAAGQPAPSAASSMMPLLMMGIIFVAFYLLIIRPQNKKQKELADKISRVKKDDKVVTIGGIHGVVEKVEDATVVVKVDEKTKLTFSKSAISDISGNSLEPAKS